MNGDRSFTGPRIFQPSFQLLYPHLQSSDVAWGCQQGVPGLSLKQELEMAGATYLRSFPRANWSLAAEHSFSRPAFSQAVHAGSLPSHYGRVSGHEMSHCAKRCGKVVAHLDFCRTAYNRYCQPWTKKGAGLPWESHILSMQKLASKRATAADPRSSIEAFSPRETRRYAPRDFFLEYAV